MLTNLIIVLILLTLDNCNSKTEIAQILRNSCRYNSKNYVTIRCDNNINIKETQYII